MSAFRANIVLAGATNYIRHRILWMSTLCHGDGKRADGRRTCPPALFDIVKCIALDHGVEDVKGAGVWAFH